MSAVRFGPFAFDARRMTLMRDGLTVALGRRAAALLEALLAAKGEIVGRDALLAAAWPGSVVEAANLTVQIAALRKAMGTRSDGGEWITTVPRVGYRLVAQGDAAAVSGAPSIAVLPFANLSDDPQQEYFADGVVEDLITALSRFKTFAVVARQSSFVFKGRGVDAREAAAALGVRYLLDGSVRRSGTTVRVTAQLIEGASGQQLWAGKFDGQSTSVFDIQDAITTAVIGLIEPQIRKAEIKRARLKWPESFDAWDLYLQALPIVYGSDVAAYDEAIELLERAVALDPGYGPAMALAAWAHEKRHTFGGREIPGVDDAERAMTLGRLALELDPDDAFALAMVGWMRILFAADFSGTRMVDRAVEINPNSTIVLQFAGTTYLHSGDLDKVIALGQRALLLSPGAPENYMSLTHIAQAYFSKRDFEASLNWSRQAVELNPHYYFGQLSLAEAAAHLGLIDEARAAAAAAVAARPDLSIASLDSDPARWPERQYVWTESPRCAGISAGVRPATTVDEQLAKVG